MVMGVGVEENGAKAEGGAVGEERVRGTELLAAKSSGFVASVGDQLAVRGFKLLKSRDAGVFGRDEKSSTAAATSALVCGWISESSDEFVMQFSLLSSS